MSILGKLRRTSNNTDISSLQTDSDSDSDEPVVKKPTPKRKPNAAKAKAKREAVIEAVEIKKEKDSNPSSEEEPLASTVAKSRNEFELNQMRAELKGFNDIEKSTNDPMTGSTISTMVEKKFDYIPKTEPNETIGTATTSGTTVCTSTSTSNTSRTKVSAENSSETDSYGDEDSQFSDKTTTLENVSDKFNKFLLNNKNATSSKHEIVATLKQSGIEKIIKTTLAEKSKALPEKPSMKTLAERTPLLKEIEKKVESDVITIEKEMKSSSTASDDKETLKEIKAKVVVGDSTSDHMSDVNVKIEVDKLIPVEKLDSKSEPNKTQSTEAECESGIQSSIASKSLSNSQEQSIADTKVTKLIDHDEVTVKVESNEKCPPTPKQIFADKSKPFNKSMIRQPQLGKDEGKTIETITDTIGGSASTTTASTCDIYEFKEPELFEFETSKKLSPETEKKTKRKAPTEPIKSLTIVTASTSASSSPPLTPAPAKRTKKPVKEPEKLKEIDEQKSPKQPLITTGSIFSVRVDSIFDSLHKSPCYVTTPDQIDEEMMMNDDCPSTSEAIPMQQIQSEIKPLFINSFVDATPEETSKIFDLKSSISDFKEELEKELESVKKIMLSDEVLNQEPPKIDKPSSIADKVLKALHSQQKMPGTSATSSESSSIEGTTIDTDTEITKPITIDVKPKVMSYEKSATPSTSTAVSTSSESATTSARATSSYRAGISPNTETATIKSVLNKIDILESISPKNNDLSETIQKLESVIQKSGEQTHLSEDTSDSTDSEQRLIIEDESQSSETPNEFVLSKQENDQSYGGKQMGSKEKTSTTTVTLSANDKQLVYGFDEKDFIDKTITITLAATSPTVATANVPATISGTDVKELVEPSSSGEPIVTFKTDEPIDKIKIDDDFSAENAQNESISLLLCEETIPGSPAPACPKDQCDLIKKNYDSIFTSPLTVADIDAKTGTTVESTTSTSDSKPNKSKNATPRSSPRDSLSQEDSSEENNKKQGKKIHFSTHSRHI